MESGERMRLGMGVGEMWRERRDVGKWERNMVEWGVWEYVRWEPLDEMNGEDGENRTK